MCTQGMCSAELWFYAEIVLLQNVIMSPVLYLKICNA